MPLLLVVAVTGDEPSVVMVIVLPDNGKFAVESTNLPDAV
jgi:hypothetical protein